MSVRTGDRSQGTLGVITDIQNLSDYTIQVCRSEKVFPKSSRWILAKPIVDERIAAYTYVRRANAVLVQDTADYKYRRSQQIEAHSHIDAMLGLIDIAYGRFPSNHVRLNTGQGLL